MNKILGILTIILIESLLSFEAAAYKNPNSWKELFEEYKAIAIESKDAEDNIDDLLSSVNDETPIEINPFMEIASIERDDDTINIELYFDGPLSFFLLSNDDFLAEDKTSTEILPRIETLSKIITMSYPKDEETVALIPYVVPYYLYMNRKVVLTIYDVSDEDGGALFIEMTLLPNGNIEEFQYGELPINPRSYEKYSFSSFKEPTSNPLVFIVNNYMIDENGNKLGGEYPEKIAPEFIGGYEELLFWLKCNMPGKYRSKYDPEFILMTLVIEPDGTPVGGRTEAYDNLWQNKVRAVVKNMPKWKPGTRNGNPSRFILEIKVPSSTFLVNRY